MKGSERITPAFVEGAAVGSTAAGSTQETVYGKKNISPMFFLLYWVSVRFCLVNLLRCEVVNRNGLVSKNYLVMHKKMCYVIAINEI